MSKTSAGARTRRRRCERPRDSTASRSSADGGPHHDRLALVWKSCPLPAGGEGSPNSAGPATAVQEPAFSSKGLALDGARGEAGDVVVEEEDVHDHDGDAREERP